MTSTLDRSDRIEPLQLFDLAVVLTDKLHYVKYLTNGIGHDHSPSCLDGIHERATPGRYFGAWINGGNIRNPTGQLSGSRDRSAARVISTSLRRQ